MKAQREVFISELFEYAKKDKDIIFISVDMGAAALDKWREELPDQFIAGGISEQNCINVAAGLSNAGKKVYVYYMACWSARCLEQIRYSCAMAKNPITIIGNGVGLGYAPAGPAHSPVDDIVYMKSINGMEIYSPSESNLIKPLVRLTLDKPALRYIRLERKCAEEVPEYKQVPDYNTHFIDVGVSIIRRGLNDDNPNEKNRTCIFVTGHLLDEARTAWRELVGEGYAVSVFDVWKIKPIAAGVTYIIGHYDNIVTIEEQNLVGGFGSSVLELMSDKDILKPTLRIGLPEKYIFDSVSREEILENVGLSSENIHDRIKYFIEGNRV